MIKTTFMSGGPNGLTIVVLKVTILVAPQLVPYLPLWKPSISEASLLFKGKQTSL